MSNRSGLDTTPAVAIAGDVLGVPLPMQITTTWTLPIRGWIAWLRAGGLPDTTLALRSYQLRRIAYELPCSDPWAVGTDDLAAWLASYAWSRETLRSYRSALRSFYGWAHASGMITTDPSRLLRKVPTSMGTPRPASERVVDDALAHADDRQWLALMLGSRHGLRRGEICQVHTRDLIEDVDGWSLLVHGKGSKDRTVPLLDPIARILLAHVDGWMFPNGFGSHLTSAHLGKVVSRVLPAGITPHQLRHRFASAAYQQTMDIRAVQILLGHASVATTQRYTAVADGSLRNAVRKAS